MKFNGILIFVVLLILISGFYIYKNANTPVVEKDTLSGTIRVSGAWALYPLMVVWGQEFEKIHPGVKVEVSAGGAGKGVTDALSEMVDIGMVSREIKKEEIDQGGFYVPVTKDAVFVSINKNNPSINEIKQKGMTKAQFIDLWVNNKGMTWGQISGGSSKDKVVVYTRSDACGAGDTWAKYLGAKAQDNLSGIGVYGDPGIAEAVNKDVLGIAYNNLNYAYDLKTGLPVEGLYVVPIDTNANGKIDENEDVSTKQKAIDAIISGGYPSPPARDLYLITKDNFKGPTREFVRWILTDGQKYVDENGYIKLQDSKIQEAIGKI